MSCFNRPVEQTSSVNALSSVGLYVCERNKDRSNQKRSWGIEANEAREMYLKIYSAVDKIDLMLLGWDVSYCSWKWWHAPTRHAKAIAMGMAYNFYAQCSEGGVDPNWKVTPISAQKFRQKLSSQMANYKASDLMYPRDEKMHGVTHKNKQRRGMNEAATIKCKDNIMRVSYEQYFLEKTPKRGKKTRLCVNNMQLFKEHVNSMKKVHKSTCQMCGEITCMKVSSVTRMYVLEGQ